VEVREIDPYDDAALAEWHAVLEAVDKEMWPDLSGWTRRDIEAFARFTGASRRFVLLAAGEPDGPTLGVGLMEFPLRDNLHSVEITVAVHPSQRRRGAGTALVERMGELARADGRRVLNVLVDVPLAQVDTHASSYFGPKVGFESTLSGNSRILDVPVDPVRLDALRQDVATARHAADYTTLTFQDPWPEEFVGDECELLRVMSTDEPAGDGEREEEVWDADRLAENDAIRRARGIAKLTAVARHEPTGRLVALSEIGVADDTPGQAWQQITVVHPEHRGHRLGLAVKIANLDFLAERAPQVRFIVTGNAKVNTPMIAVNDMLGFKVNGEGRFWQKHLAGVAASAAAPVP
jgi:GNAT superfamily N-acetyltransferase